MSKKDELKNKGIRGRLMLSKLGVEIDSNFHKKRKTSDCDNSEDSIVQHECEESEKNNNNLKSLSPVLFDEKVSREESEKNNNYIESFSTVLFDEKVSREESEKNNNYIESFSTVLFDEKVSHPTLRRRQSEDSNATFCGDDDIIQTNRNDPSESNVAINLRKSTIRSLSLNDLTEDKVFTKKIRKFYSAPTIKQELSTITRCSPWLFLIHIEQENNEADYAHLLPVEESLSTNTENVDYGDLSEGRKRRIKADPMQWKKNIAKRQRMQGKSYLGYSKPRNRKAKQDTIRASRDMGPSCSSDFCLKSKLRGCYRFTDQSRKIIHENFWKNLNWDQRRVYVAGLVSRSPTSRKTKCGGVNSKRQGTLTYFLPLKIYDSEEKIQVCREMFLRTLSLGRATVQEWVKKAVCGMVTSKENARISVTVSKKTVTANLQTLNNFLDKLPKLPSHYARKDTTKLFLEPQYTTATELFKKYKEYCTSIEKNPMSRFTFDQNFKEKNLSLYTLKKDMCDICSSYKAGNLDEAEYQVHCIKKDRARKEKEADKEKAKNGEFILLTMDLEAVKVCPFLTASALYFKTKLTCHNFTVYDLVSHHCTCYWFNETDADLTASTFVSFIIDYIERHCLQRKLPIVIFSDGCTYQNRNVVLSNALLHCSVKNNVTIIQKYLEPGHTQMECDSVHSAIERKLKNKEIYLPSDYIRLTKEARAQNPYECIYIDYTFVKNYADPKTHVYKSIRPGRRPGDPQVTHLKQIKYNPDASIEISLNFDSDWIALPQRARIPSGEITYSQLNAAKIPIKKTKFNHLQQLKTVLPQDCHHFYDTLPYEE